MPSLLERVREKLKSANDAKTKEERARERVRKAVNRIQLEEAREKLRAARIEREIKETQARIALETARARVDLAKAQGLKASEAKWKARYARAGSIVGVVAGPTASGAKLAGKGLKQLGDWLWKEQKPARRRKSASRVRRATSAKRSTKRKTVAKRR